MRTMFGFVLVLAAFAAAADSPSDSLAARHDSAVATPEGAAYERVVGQTVAENFSSIQRCFPGRHTTLQVTVLFEITPNGTVGAADVVPQGVEGNCASLQLHKIKFPGAPPPNFVGKFNFVVAGT